MTDGPLGRFGRIEGRSERVTATLTGVSFRQTSAGRRYPYPDFGSDFIVALHEALPCPRRRGLFRRELACPACGRSLDGNVTDRVTAAADIDLRRIPAIHLDLVMPGVVCRECGLQLVRTDDRPVASDLSDALIDAFDRARMSPG